ncbi:flagellin [Vogesella sp. LIG4]|uniref:flagellin N-terminal helical domain-containing protein n=1 Tax=Vogesella sp. LIG4 TaxID=1192162 RepID=UPI00081FB006|nr:flagellin [Vogesella sp. LIG4]SCK17414.1 flagellin [Vogesella sp. LIG4]
MLSLYTNAASLSTQSAMSSTQKDLSTSMQRLGTGYRINSAMDDAAGLQIATRLNAQVSGMKVAMRNTQNDISMLQTGEGALNEATNILTRMKDLATQAADASSSANDQTAMQAEYDALGRELNNIMSNTSFGGQKLLMGTGTGSGTAAGSTFSAAVSFQIGSSASETMSFNASTQLNTMDTGLQSVSATYKTPAAATVGTELTAAGGATTAIGNLSTALDNVGALRSAMGAAANRLDHVYNNLSNMSNNVSQAKGRIMDTDYASESANMTTKQMLMQASTAMLKQSNGMSSMAMSLLQ